MKLVSVAGSILFLFAVTCQAMPERDVNRVWTLLRHQGFHPPSFTAPAKYQRPGKLGIVGGQVERIATLNGAYLNGTSEGEIRENILYPGFIFELDIASSNWSQIDDASEDAPSPRAFAGADYYAAGNKLIYFGGVAISNNFQAPNFFPQFFNDLWEYDFSTGEWTELSPTGTPPFARASFVHCIIEDVFYVFSGFGLDLMTFQFATDNALYAYNITSNHWSLKIADDPLDPDLPTNRSQAGFQVQPGRDRLVMTGGDSFVPDPNVPAGIRAVTLTDVWVYNANNNKWKQLASTNFPDPAPSQFGFAFKTTNRFWIQNGDRQGEKTVNDTCNALPLLNFDDQPSCFLPNTPSDETFEYSMLTESWTKINLLSVPPKTRRSELWFDDGVFYLAGGNGWEGSEPNYYRQRRLINGQMTDEFVAPAEIPQLYTWKMTRRSQLMYEDAEEE